MRTGLTVFTCIAHCVLALGQQKDSVLLNAVNVYSLQDPKYLAGSTLQSLDSTIKANENSRPLSEVLSSQFPVYFRTYGNGMLSGISMRGTSPAHTAVLWNGININSFSLGQADFSILPSSAFDEVQVHEGGGSARFGSGAFGGTVLVSSRNKFANTLRVTEDIGSFNRYFSSIGGSISIKRWGFQTRIYNILNKNDFRILSSGTRQKEADFRQSGILQDIVYRWNPSRQLTLHYWYHDSDRNIQPGIGQLFTADNQQDRNHRLIVGYTQLYGKGDVNIYGGYVNDIIVYDGSKSEIERSITGIRNEYQVGRIHTQLGSEWNHITGHIKDWEQGKATEDRFDFTGSAQSAISRFSIAVNMRQPVVPGLAAPLLPYAGLEYRIAGEADKVLKARGSVSKNYRIPTLNDRYWQNAGDKKLSPETSHAAEGGLSWKGKHLTMTGTAFTQFIDEWIQWVPQENGIYRPKNIKQVTAKGFESSIEEKFKISGVGVSARVAYQYTASITRKSIDNDLSVGKQLIYTPVNTANAYLQLQSGNWFGSVSVQYAGKRFTEASNSEMYALRSYDLIDASVSRRIFIGSHELTTQLSVKNMFNQDYTLYAGKAMPGRNFNFQIVYQLKQTE